MPAYFNNAIMNHAKFTCANLGPSDFTGAIMDDAIFAGVSAEGAIFNEASMQRINMSDAKLQGASFTNANLRRANLQKSKLQNASFVGACLEGADLRGAKVRDADFRGAYVHGAKLPSDVKLQGSFSTPMAQIDAVSDSMDGSPSTFSLASGTPSSPSNTVNPGTSSEASGIPDSPSNTIRLDGTSTPAPPQEVRASVDHSGSSQPPEVNSGTQQGANDIGSLVTGDCVVCMENQANFVCSHGHLILCSSCRRKMVYEALAQTDPEWRNKSRRDLNARQLDRTAIVCPICRVKSSLAAAARFDGQIFVA
eukprot:gnl/TRDRNA2_/TRDRNA2_89879_c0_seq2.p1 gnl/TRDRNA2_/TRDRNA2_89879_c0~~gnl/TRDRNA2_/TRDRNA2_89879_c0_seq2.p1  ORF type:complete len:309 (-),score=40.54 gnl/TRDRNA2_/TRDRNA2_89879_c0_seq2:217-1143(-)